MQPKPTRPSVFSPAYASLPRIAGFALLLSFSTMQSLIGSRMPGGFGGLSLLVFERLAEAAAFAVVALAAGRCAGLGGRRRLVWVCAGVCTLAAATECTAVMLEGTAGLYGIAHIMWCAVGGVCPSILWMAWIELYARMDMRRVMPYYLLANVLQAVLTLALSGGDPLRPGVIALVGALPLASAALLRTAFAQEETAPLVQGAPAAGPRRFPTIPVVLMGVFSFANVFARDVLPAEDRAWATVGVIACLVMLLVALRLGNVRFGVWPLYGAAFPLTLAGLFGLLLDGPTWGVAATLCTHAGETLFAVFIGVTLCNLAFRYGISALVAFGFAQAAGSLASLAGALLAFSGLVRSRETLTLAVAGMGLALAVCYVALTRGQGEVTWGIEAHEGTPGEKVADGASQNAGARCAQPEAAGAGASARNGNPLDVGARRIASGTRSRGALEDCCSLIAYEYGLTRREEEVLALLAQDRSAAEIEGTLCVSNSTVKSHTHAVYQKLGLHSRAELVEFVREGLEKRIP